MFWIITFFVIGLALLGDEFGVLDEKSSLSDNKLFIKKPLRKKTKEVEISSITQIRMLLNEKGVLILMPGIYGRSVIQINTNDKWETIAVNRLFNHSRNKTTVNFLLSQKPSVTTNSTLKEYLTAQSIGDLYINKKQIYRGLLLLGIIAVFILLGFLFSGNN